MPFSSLRFWFLKGNSTRASLCWPSWRQRQPSTSGPWLTALLQTVGASRHSPCFLLADLDGSPLPRVLSTAQYTTGRVSNTGNTREVRSSIRSRIKSYFSCTPNDAYQYQNSPHWLSKPHCEPLKTERAGFSSTRTCEYVEEKSTEVISLTPVGGLKAPVSFRRRQGQIRVLAPPLPPPNHHFLLIRRRVKERARVLVGTLARAKGADHAGELCEQRTHRRSASGPFWPLLRVLSLLGSFSPRQTCKGVPLF